MQNFVRCKKEEKPVKIIQTSRHKYNLDSQSAICL